VIVVSAGPAASETGMESSAASVNSSLGDTWPRLMIATKRKLANETAGAATGTSVTAKLSTKSSIKSRLGEPVTIDRQPKLMIPTKKKQVEETVVATVAVGMQSETGNFNTKSSVKSRLGEQISSSSQSGLMISADRKRAADNEPLSNIVSAKYNTVFSRLGPSHV